jgi:hypothetical protein
MDDAMRTACAAWSSFEPIPGHVKEHSEILYFPEESTHFFEGNDVTEVSATSLYQDTSPFRKALIEEFCPGCQKFMDEVSLASIGDAPFKRYKGYSRAAASSRRYQVADGDDFWTTSAPSPAPPAAEEAPATSATHRTPGVPKQWSFAGRVLG